ncbi:MAG: hypothetical protein H7A47_05965 [Verrucomicrobiales bacterium]|nr:hypothetical protein [Verrucomicrobiales bacterium]
MRTLILGILVVATLGAAPDRSGYIDFNNHVRYAGVDAPVYRPDGTGAGEGCVAQLWLVLGEGSLEPLSDLMGFRTQPATATPYVFGGTVAVWGFGPAADVTVRMRAWEAVADSFETAMIRGESNEVTVSLHGDDLVPLVGLEGFTMHVVPEPSAATLGLLGLAFVWLARKRPPHPRDQEITGAWHGGR